MHISTPVYLNSFGVEMHSDALVCSPNGQLQEHTYKSLSVFMEQQGITLVNCIESVQKDGNIVVYVLQGYESPYRIAVQSMLLYCLFRNRRVYCLNVSIDKEQGTLFMHDVTWFGKMRLCIAEYQHTAIKKANLLGIQLQLDEFKVCSDGNVCLVKANQIVNGVYHIPPFVTTVKKGCFANYKGNVLCVVNQHNRLESLEGIFMSCRLTVLDLTQFSTQGVTNMSFMFANAHIDEIKGIECLDTSSVEDISCAFSELCTVQQLNLCAWHTDKMENLRYTFRDTQTPVLNIDTWTTNNLKTCAFMFSGCKATIIKCGMMNVSRVENMAGMFSHSAVQELDLSAWRPVCCTAFQRMFEYSDLKTLHFFCADLSRDVAMVFNGMFQHCDALTTVYLPKQTIIPKQPSVMFDVNVWKNIKLIRK